MVQIKVNGDGIVPDGTILEPVYIDDVGDARLNDEDARKYDISWVFRTAFKVVDEEREANGYRVIITAQNPLDVHTILDRLPENMVESATLEKI